MVPLEEAGQPVVIGGVVIDHEDQKVSLSLRLCVFFNWNVLLVLYCFDCDSFARLSLKVSIKYFLKQVWCA